MGPLPDLAEPTHYAGLKYGMIWTEGATNLRELPSTGAFYCLLAPKHELGPYSEGRAFSVVGGELPKRLIDACRHKRAIDLSPTLSPKLPLTSSGIDTGNHRQVYLKIDFLYSEYLDMWHHGHFMDSMTGTHLVPPSYALPADDKPIPYAPVVRGWLDEYEKLFKDLHAAGINIPCECIFLTYNNTSYKNAGDDVNALCWKPEIQESKDSEYAADNIRYKYQLKAKMIEEFKKLYSNYFDPKNIRYIF